MRAARARRRMSIFIAMLAFHDPNQMAAAKLGEAFSQVADAVVYMLTRKRTVTIRDMLVLPTNFDRV